MTGRSPVKLSLFDTNAADFLYVNSVTKHVPIARDMQLQTYLVEKSKDSPFKSSGKFMDTNMMASPHMAARFELTNRVHEPFSIRNRNNQIRHVSIGTPI